MALAQTLGALIEHCDDVSVEDYLARRRPMPHLFDLAPHMDPAAFQPHGGAIGAPLYAALRLGGDRQTDVRVLVEDGERYLELARRIAKHLRCDVYLTPHGADVRYVRESSSVTGESFDAIAVDRAAAAPADWVVIRPADLPADVPTWFTSTRGRLRQSSGLMTVTLPDGIAFATKATFRDTTYLAARMKAGASRVTTVAVNADIARFEISRFDDAGALLGGVELATLVAASLDVIHPDVQLALTWPTDAAACEALDVELMRFADALNRTVWVPQPQGATFVLPGCGEFAAVDEVGGPSRWRAYPSRLTADWKSAYGTDLDGRLVPLGDVAAARFPGVPFVSVAANQLTHLRPWYQSVAPCDGLFGIDLAVLGDGRLGIVIDNGIALAIGPRELRTQLREAGWSGEDLLLLAQPPAERWDAAIQHARSLVALLAVDVWLPAVGAEVWTQPDGTLAADAPDGTDLAWFVVAYGQSGDLAGAEGIALPPALAGARMAGQSIPRARSAPPEIAAPAEIAALPEVEPGAEEGTAEGTDGGGGVLTGTIEAVAVLPAPVEGSGAPHAVPWLPPTPVVNPRAVDLYVWTPMATDQLEGWGLPSADLFLLAGRDPLRLADRRRNGYLLRVLAPRESAVDLVEHARHAPATIAQRLLDTGCTHLLPLAWLSELRVTARFDLDGLGGISARSDVGAGALAIRFEGAEHGVPGLPNEVVNWPDKGQRAGAPSYLMLPENTVLDRQIVHRGFIALSRRKPELEDGHLLLEVKVRKRRAIDVPATLDNLAGLPVVGRLHDFVGLDLLLPEDDLSKAVVSRIWRYGPGGRPVVDKLSGETLSDALATDALDYAGAR